LVVNLKIIERERFNYPVCSVMVLLLVLCAVSSFAGVHDPMQPQVGYSRAASKITQSVDLNLEATVISAQRQIAVINGTTLRVGDNYEGYRLTAIDESHVVLVAQGKKRVLALQPVVKTRIKQTN